MPEENKNGQGAGQGESGGNGAGTGSAAGGNGNTAGAGSAAGGNGNGAGEETISVKKSDFEKLKTDLDTTARDRDNYKTGLINLKRKHGIDDGEAGGEGAGGQGGQGAQGGGQHVVDVAKAGQIATEAARKIAREGAQKTAKARFLKAHPEYVNDSDYQRMLTHLTFKGEEITEAEVYDRLEAALLEDKRSTGRLDEHLNNIRESGRQQGRTDGIIDEARSTGGQGDGRGSGGGQGGFTSGKGEQMAKAMHTDPEKAKKIDPSKDNVINVL